MRDGGEGAGSEGWGGVGWGEGWGSGWGCENGCMCGGRGGQIAITMHRLQSLPWLAVLSDCCVRKQLRPRGAHVAFLLSLNSTVLDQALKGDCINQEDVMQDCTGEGGNRSVSDGGHCRR